ncbi:hypothetical protein [Streptomyces sp. NPDC093991]
MGEAVCFWSADDPVLLMDSAMDQVLKEVGSIRRAVRPGEKG